MRGWETDLSGLVLGNLVLGVLLAALALAVGLTGLRNVDLQRYVLLASALIHLLSFHPWLLAARACPQRYASKSPAQLVLSQMLNSRMGAGAS